MYDDDILLQKNFHVSLSGQTLSERSTFSVGVGDLKDSFHTTEINQNTSLIHMVPGIEPGHSSMQVLHSIC